MSQNQVYNPTGSGSGSTTYGTSTTTNGAVGAGAGIIDDSKPVTYECGDCAAKVTLKRGEAIRCKECGHRVLYKMRTSRMVQFEAR